MGVQCCTAREAENEGYIEDPGLIGEWVYHRHGRYTIARSENQRQLRIIETLQNGRTVTGTLKFRDSWWEAELSDQVNQEPFGIIRLRQLPGKGTVSQFRTRDTDWGADVGAMRRSARRKQALTTHKSGATTSVAFSPASSSSNIFASASLGSGAKLWSSPDASWFDEEHGTISEDYVLARDSKDAKVACLAFSVDGNLLATASGGSVTLWYANTQERLPNTFSAKYGVITCLAFSPDGVWLSAATSGIAIMGPQLLTWDIKDSADIRSRSFTWSSHKAEISSIAFSTLIVNGTPKIIMASGSFDETVRLWDIETREKLGNGVLKGGMKKVHSCAFSHDGALLAAGSEDAYVHLWDVATQERKPLRLQCAAEATLKTEPVLCVAFSPCSLLLATGTSLGRVLLFDVEAYLSVETAAESTSSALPDAKRSGASSPSHSSGAAQAMRKSVRSRIEPLLGHEGQVNTVAFSSDGQLLASGGSDRRTILWEV